jgi:hypothetical protein
MLRVISHIWSFLRLAHLRNWFRIERWNEVIRSPFLTQFSKCRVKRNIGR